MSNFSAISRRGNHGKKRVTFEWDDDNVGAVPSPLVTSSLKQQSADRDEASQLWHINLISSQPVFALILLCSLLMGA
jgi:hypothetical protein